jgi:hypothetical protein
MLNFITNTPPFEADFCGKIGGNEVQEYSREISSGIFQGKLFLNTTRGK